MRSPHARAIVTGVTAVLAVALAVGVRAQTHQGGVRGTVRDATGIVPGASVVLIDENTSGARTTTSNVRGEYAVPNVAPGIYTLIITLPGFKAYESRGLRIGTQDALALDVVLAVGDLRETVVVTGATPRLERATASVSAVLDRTVLEALPNPARNTFTLATTTPTVLPTGSPQFVRMQDQNQASMLSVAGGLRRASSFKLDGLPIEDLFSRAVMMPSIEAVDEVKVQVSTYDAELGRTGGGVFNTTMRSGANTWRGTALYLTRPEWGTARQYFTRQTGQAKPDTSYRLWAGAVGGPIVEGRTFFWATTEGYASTMSSSGSLTLPTARERLGDFSQSARPIYDPLTTREDPSRPGQYIRDPFPGNVIPSARIDQVAGNLARQLPVPTTGRSLPYTTTLADLTNQATIKVDHRLSARLALSGLFAWYHSDEPSGEFYGGGVPGDPGAGSQPRTVNVAGLNAVSTPGEWTTLTFRYGYMRFRDDSAWQPNDPSSLGFAPAFARELTGYPAVFVEAYGLGGELFNGGTGQQSTHSSHVVNTSLSRLVGRHVLKAGAEYRRLGLLAVPSRQASFNFGPAFTAGPSANSTQNGDAFASFLLGIPQRGEFTIPTPTELFTNYVAGFVQDDFRVGANLTVNVGLRYEFEQGLQERQDAFTVGFDRARAFPVQVPGLDLRGGLMYAGVDRYPTHQGDPSSGNFAPRVGVAWSVDARTVVRAGYGLFWAPTQIPQALSQAGLGTRGFTGTTTYVASNDGGLTPCAGCSLTNPFPSGVSPPQGAALGLLTGAGGDIDFIDQSSGSASVHRFSADVQRELPGRLALSLGYVGSRGYDLAVGGTIDGALNINQLDPQYLALGSALQQAVPNPFRGIPEFGTLSLNETIPRGQLLAAVPTVRQRAGPPGDGGPLTLRRVGGGRDPPPA
jgi:hypothetical protein